MNVTDHVKNVTLFVRHMGCSVFVVVRARSQRASTSDGWSLCHTVDAGKGIGTQILRELQHYAQCEGYASIRLDVIDINPAARRLYERMGFVIKKTVRFESLRWLLGFGASTAMEHEIGRLVQ